MCLSGLCSSISEPPPDDLSSFQLCLPVGEMCRCWGSRAGGTDHYSTGVRRGTQALSCCCLGRDLRLIEVTETICKRLLDYSLHKERTGSNRFAKVGFVLALHPHRGQAACLSVSAGLGATGRSCPGSIPPRSLPVLHPLPLAPLPPERPDFSVAVGTSLIVWACPLGSCLSPR